MRYTPTLKLSTRLVVVCHDDRDQRYVYPIYRRHLVIQTPWA